MSTRSMSLIKNTLQITDLSYNPELEDIIGILKPGLWTNGPDCLHLTHMFIVFNFLSGNNIASIFTD